MPGDYRQRRRQLLEVPEPLRSWMEHPFLTPDEQREAGRSLVAARAIEDPEARERAMAPVVERLARSAARYAVQQSLRHARVYHLQPDDAFLGALYGLVEAARRYDGSTLFTTFARWWIRRGVQDVEAELAAWTGASYTARRARRSGSLPLVFQAGGFNSGSRSGASFDGKVSYEEPEAPPSEAEVEREHSEMRARAEWILREAVLPGRDREIVRRRFGLADGRERTLAEVSEQFGVVRERIRQIELRALRSMGQFAARNHLTLESVV